MRLSSHKSFFPNVNRKVVYFMGWVRKQKDKIKGIVMQVEKVPINDRLRVSKVS